MNKAVTASMISGYNKTKLGSQTVTVNYTVTYTLSDGNTLSDNFTKTFTVNVQNTAKAIEITPPTKTTYHHGETLNLAGGSIKVTNQDNTVANVAMTTAMITENGASVNMSPATYDNTNKVVKTLKIAYEQDGITKQVDYPITIINDVKSISLQGTPKTNYNVNDPRDTNLEILVSRAAGTPEVIKVTDAMIANFSTTTEGARTAVITYTENGITKTVDYSYVVADKVKSISIKTMPKETQKYNTNLDLANATIEVVKGSKTETIPLTSAMIKTGTYDKTTLGTQVVTVEYGTKEDGSPATTTFTVNVKDYVTGISITPNEVNAVYNDELQTILDNNTITYTVTYAKAGAQIATVVTQNMVTGYNKTKIGAQTLTVTYTDNNENSFTKDGTFTANLKVTIPDKVTQISITKPNKTTYKHGEAFNLTGGIINLTYASTKTDTVNLTTAMLKEADGVTTASTSPLATDFGTNTTFDKTLKIVYSKDGVSKQIDYPITIVNDVREITMHTTPKTSYNVNDTIDLTTDGTNYGEILVTRAVGTAEVVKLNDSKVQVTGFNASRENTNLPLTVTYTENGISKNTSYNISVTDSVKSISIKTTPKTDYKYNEELSITGGQIEVVKGSGTTTIPLTSSMVTGYNKETLGEQTITVTYGGKETTYKVTVKDYVTEIAVNPSTVSATVGDSLEKILSDNSIMYTVIYAKAGARPPTTLTKNMVTGYNASSSISQNLTVTYVDTDISSATNGQSFTKTLRVTFPNAVTKIELVPPTKKVYNHGEILDLSGGSMKLTYASGDVATENLNMATITEADGSTVNMSPSAEEFKSSTTINKTLKITYIQDGVSKTIDYSITIVNDVKEITMHTTPKTSYNVNDTIDLTTDGTNYGEILVTRAVGTAEVIKLNDSKVQVTGFNTSTENANLELTVTYTENGISKNTNYNISVTDSVKSISIKTTPKTNYKYNEELSVDRGELEVVSGSGTTTIPLTSSMVTGYNKETLGEQTITVTYGGKETTYKVIVKDYVTGITVNPTQIDGIYNQELADLINNNSITYTVNYAKAGDKTPNPLSQNMVTGYDKTSVSSQNLTVTYVDTDTNSATNTKEFTANLTVVIPNAVTAITITPPTKTTYKDGEELDLSGSSMQITYAQGEPETKELTADMIKEQDGSDVKMSLDISEYEQNHTKAKTLKISYTKDGITGKADYPITIINDVREITMQTLPKTKYNVNDSLDLTTDGTNYGEISVSRAKGTPEIVKLNDSKVQVTGFDASTENANLELTVTYTENNISQTTKYTVSVKDSVKSIKLLTTPKAQYKYNEELDVSEDLLEIEKGSEKISIPLTTDMITGYDKTVLGEQELTIEYGGQQIKYTVNVKDYVTEISITPNTVTGTCKDTLQDLIDDYNIMYTVTYAKTGAGTPSPLLESMVAGYNDKTTNEQNLEVTYTDNDENSATKGQDFTTSLAVTLQDQVDTISIKDKPGKLTYHYEDQSLDLSGGSILVTTQSGITEEKSFTADGVTITQVDGSPINLQNVTFDTNHQAVKIIKVNYAGKSDTFEITITNQITKIEMENMPKTEYQIGQTLDLSIDGTTPGTIKVTRQNGETDSITLTNNSIMVTNFDSTAENTNLRLDVSYTENGITKTTNYSISVVDIVTSVEFGNMPKTAYKYGETLDVSTGTLLVTRSSGQAQVPMNENMVTELDGSSFDSTNMTPRKLKVTYGGKELFYDITVSDYVTGILLTPPTKKDYECGESLQLDGGTVQAVMASGAPTTPVDLTDSSVQLGTFDPNKEGTQTISVTYEGFTESFGVTVTDNIQSISVENTPKTDYEYGEELDVTGGTIIASKSSGATEKINITKEMVTGFDSTVIGTQTLTITYKEKQTSYQVTIKDKVQDIKIKEPDKLIYKLGEEISLAGGTVELVMASGKPTTPVSLTDSNVTVVTPSTNAEGSYLVKVTYQGFTKNFYITVVDQVTSTYLSSLPTKLHYKYGEALDVTGAAITVVKESGASSIIAVTKDMVTGYNPNKLGDQKLTVTYEGNTWEFTVHVEDIVKGLKVTKPNKTKYEYGDSLDLTGGKVAIVMASGTLEQEAELTASMVSGFESTKEGKQTIQVEYQGLKGEFTIQVIDEIKAITMFKSPDKTEYQYNEKLDVTGAKITVIKSGGIYEVSVTDKMVSGYKPKTAGNQFVTVTYEGFETSFLVTVGEEPVVEQPQRPVRPVRPSRPVEEPIEEPQEPITPQEPEKPVRPQEPQKPTEVLGVQDRNDTIEKEKLLAGIIGFMALLLMIVLILTKRNVNIYVEEEKEFVLGGKTKLTKNNLYIDINPYLDDETYLNKVKVRLSDAISEKLDGKEIEIKHRGNIIKYKVHYENKPYEIILE
jgi:hypothetical protein